MATFPLLSGCTAIITGASSGLGSEFARQLAGRASCVVLAARNADALDALANELRAGSPALKMVTCACDLATEEGRARLWAAVDAAGIHPTVLINNAGLGDYGSFVRADAARIRQQIDVNITALTMVAREFAARRLAAREGGGMINLSSLASTLPMPDLAVYAATKAYVSSLSEALAIELQDGGIRVLAVCPGPTPTNFSKTARREAEGDIDRSGQDFLRVSPSFVVSTSLLALEKGKTRHFPGWRTGLAGWLFEQMPRPLLRFMMRLRHRRSMLD